MVQFLGSTSPSRGDIYLNNLRIVPWERVGSPGVGWILEVLQAAGRAADALQLLAARRKQLNPNGIPALSPGLRGTSYPGSARPTNLNPNGVEARPFFASWRLCALALNPDALSTPSRKGAKAQGMKRRPPSRRR